MGCRTKGKKPTRKQKIFMGSKGLNVQNWLVLRDDEVSMYIESKKSGRTKCIYK